MMIAPITEAIITEYTGTPSLNTEKSHSSIFFAYQSSSAGSVASASLSASEFSAEAGAAEAEAAEAEAEAASVSGSESSNPSLRFPLSGCPMIYILESRIPLLRTNFPKNYFEFTAYFQAKVCRKISFKSTLIF